MFFGAEAENEDGKEDQEFDGDLGVIRKGPFGGVGVMERVADADEGDAGY